MSGFGNIARAIGLETLFAQWMGANYRGAHSDARTIFAQRHRRAELQESGIIDAITCRPHAWVMGGIGKSTLGGAMSGWFRTYAPDWSWTGYARDRQYPGQAEIPTCETDGCELPAERVTGPLPIRQCADGHTHVIKAEEGQ